MPRYHTDNWLFAHSNGGDGKDDLRLRVFLTIHPNGYIEASTRTLDGGLLRSLTGQLKEVPYYNRNGRYSVAYAVQVYNCIGEPSGTMLDTEKTVRWAAYRLADRAVELSCYYNPAAR